MNASRKILILAAMVIFFGLLAAILFSENGFMALQRLKKEKQELVRKNEALNAENLQLYRTIKRLKHDPEYIESVARQELGMTGKDEIILKFKSKPKD